MSHLLKTKLYPPPVTSELVPRRELLERLERNGEKRPFTLISAPAGFGKSVLASMWLERCHCPSGWVSLDERDNDLPTFTAYLFAAIKMAFPDISLDSEALLKTPTPLPPSILARSLLNDLDQIKKPSILVLDDLHVIHDKAIFDFLTEIMEHPPRALHMVLISRQDPPLPVASLRVYRRITEIRMRDLRFKPPEAAKLLNQVLQREIEEDLANEWTRQTEGWPTALHLVALSLRPYSETTHIRASVQDHSQHLQEYLLVEVLNTISPDNQTWLLKTALLDRFCAPLCEAICQEEGEDLTGQTFMTWLQRSNLFLVSLDNQGEWFRFHHLFQHHLQNLLQKQVSDEEIANHHLRASRWLAGNGWVEEAIHHALLAGDTETAVTILIQKRHQLMNKDQWNNLEHMINMLPETAVAHNLILLLTKAHIASVRSKDAELFKCWEQAKRLVNDLPSESLIEREVQGEISLLQCMEALFSGQAADLITHGKRANEYLPKDALHLRSAAMGFLLAGFQMSGDLSRGVSLINESLITSTWPPFIHAKLLLYLGLAYFMDADLPGAKHHISECLRLSNKHEFGVVRSQAHYILGKINYLHNDLTAAEANLLPLLENPAISAPSYLAHAVCMLSRIYHHQNKPEEASRILEQTSTYFESSWNSTSLEIMRAFEVELALDQGDFVRANYLSSLVNFNARPPLWFYYVPQLTPIKILLAQQSTHHIEEALSNLAQLEDYIRALNRKTIHIDVLALQALAYEAQENWQKAAEKLDRALRLAQPGGFIRNFVDLGPPMASLMSRLQKQNKATMGSYISQILTAFPTVNQSPPAPALNTMLSRRELQTLKLLNTDLSPEDIAVQMSISPATVRTHTRNIYAKLKVNGRFQAVYRAKELGLIAST
ncbi:MAG: hypothetical protein IPJ94_27425 [Chloroflexi bacterium]|nr:hypothetical protein [Chloroflexota bacterium]